MRRYWFFVAGTVLVIILLIWGIFNLSGDRRITSFWFAEEDNPSLHEDVDGVIEGDMIQIVLEDFVEVEHLIPTFTHTGKRVTVDGVKQVSKKTANDFSREIVFTVTAANGSTQDYTVVAYMQNETGLRPPLPTPVTYDGVIPLRSREVMVEQVELVNIDFAPIINTAVAEKRIREERNIFTGNWKISDEANWNKEIDLTDFSGNHRIPLVKEGHLLTDPHELQVQKKIPNKLLVIPQREHYLLNPLQEKPQLQVVRYWALTDPQAGVYRLTPNEGVTVSTQVPVGVNEKSRKSFAATIGAEGEHEVELFNLLVNSQFEAEYLPNERAARESILPIEASIQPAKSYRVVAVYKLVHEFRFVRANGQPFTDPKYQFEPESLKPLLYVNSKDVVIQEYTFRRYKP